MLNASRSNLEQFLAAMPEETVTTLKALSDEDNNGISYTRMKEYQQVLNQKNVFFDFGLNCDLNDMVYIKTISKNSNLLFFDDVDIYDNARTIVYLNGNSMICVKITRPCETEKVWVHGLELYDSPEDCWLNQKELDSLNNTMDTDYCLDEEFDDFIRKVRFSSDVADMHGPDNFDTQPFIFKTHKKFHKWLRKVINFDKF